MLFIACRLLRVVVLCVGVSCVLLLLFGVACCCWLFSVVCCWSCVAGCLLLVVRWYCLSFGVVCCLVLFGYLLGFR